MRKIFTVLAAAAALTVSAQNAFVGNKFLDNWSVGVFGGAATDIHGMRSSLGYADAITGSSNPGSFWERARAVAGIELTKQWTPIFATSVMGETSINSTPGHTVFDTWGVMLANKVNFSNLFAGYNGKPRFLEVEGVVAIGMGSHILNDDYRIPVVDRPTAVPDLDDDHYFATRMGLNFNFNLGAAKAWTVSLKPAIVYNLDQETYHGIRNGKAVAAHPYKGASYNINYAKAELTAGVTYHFKNSNGEHYFTNVKAYDQGEIDALNARINALRAQLDAKDADIAKLNREIAKLRKELEDCLNREPIIKYIEKEVPTGVDRSRLTTLVHFPINQTVITDSQVPNVERVAAYLKKNPNATVTVEGWASVDGPADNNKRLSVGRAEAVKNMLVKKYGIAANRIDARSVGNGILQEYSIPEWNRVSECTIVVADK